jgi:hypothetical protein
MLHPSCVQKRLDGFREVFRRLRFFFVLAIGM